MNDQSGWFSDHWESVLFAVYLLGVLVAASKFIIGLRKIYSLYNSAKIIATINYTVINTNENHLPFSFFKMLYWSEKYHVDEYDKEKIIKHEEAHIEGRHSLDIIILELLSIVFWCSPLVYFYKKAIKTVHEYLADDMVLQTTSTKHYGHLLLSQSQTGMQMALGNNLIHSQLKKRILMMTKDKSKQKNILKYGLVVPVLLLMFMAFSKQDINANDLDQRNSVVSSQSNKMGFDASVVKKSLNEVISKYNADSNSSEKEKLSKAYLKEIKKHISEYPKYKNLILSIANGLIFERKIPWALVNNSSGVDIKECTMEELEKMIADSKNYEGELFKIVEKMPRFPGCHEGSEAEKQECASLKMLQFIYQNIKYPKEARAADIQGVVVVRFVVSKQGEILDAEVIRDIGGGCGEEALRVANLMPMWEPGMQRGKAVNVQFNLPVKFKLGEKIEDEKNKKN